MKYFKNLVKIGAKGQNYQEYQDCEIPGFTKASKIRGFKVSRNQGFGFLGINGIKFLRLQGFRVFKLKGIKL
jgi:hypothetical protein